VAQLFPRWTNKIPVYLAIGVVILAVAVVFLFWYYGSPKYLEVGYQPRQPVPYSHKLHAGDLGLDCRYCHTSVENSPAANVPPTQTCMNCHELIKPESGQLEAIRRSWKEGVPVRWTRVHMLPDYAFFNHSAHVNAGVGCESCHGNVAQMEVVEQEKPLSMQWCLDCHRNPELHIRPMDEVTTMGWQPRDNQLEYASKIIEKRNINAPTDCSGCHR